MYNFEKNNLVIISKSIDDVRDTPLIMAVASGPDEYNIIFTIFDPNHCFMRLRPSDSVTIRNVADDSVNSCGISSTICAALVVRRGDDHVNRMPLLETKAILFLVGVEKRMLPRWIRSARHNGHFAVAPRDAQ